MPGEPVLGVRDLRVRFPGGVTAVDGLSFDVEHGQVLGIVGESGSGKSATGLSVLGLHDRTEVSGSISFDGKELVGAPERELRRLRGDDLAMVFQDPLSSLHPHHTVGRQISEAYLVHNRAGRQAARARAVEMLARVGIPSPERRYDEYPHPFSGGMRQRVMIAMALVCEPRLLVADEPTTTLDVTVQAQIEIQKSTPPGGVRDEVTELMARVGLDPTHHNRYPHEFSGGQRQRIGIARAIVLRPKLIVCDEPVPALDVSIQAQIVNLLADLRDEFGMAYVFVAHDLAVVRHISDRVAVMYLGRIVELADSDSRARCPRYRDDLTEPERGECETTDPLLAHWTPRWGKAESTWPSTSGGWWSYKQLGSATT